MDSYFRQYSNSDKVDILSVIPALAARRRRKSQINPWRGEDFEADPMLAAVAKLIVCRAPVTVEADSAVHLTDRLV